MTQATQRRTRPMTGARDNRRVLTAIGTGIALTVVALVAPIIDLTMGDIITTHVREAYPEWTDSQVAADRGAIAGYLVVLAALGLAAWSVTAWAIRQGKRWSRGFATASFAVGGAITTYTFGASGAAYDRIVPTLFGTLTLLPAVAGLVVVVMLWTSPHKKAIAQG